MIRIKNEIQLLYIKGNKTNDKSNKGAKSKMNKQTQASKYCVSCLLKDLKTISSSDEIYYKALSSNVVIPLFVIKFKLLSSIKRPL